MAQSPNTSLCIQGLIVNEINAINNRTMIINSIYDFQINENHNSQTKFNLFFSTTKTRVLKELFKFILYTIMIAFLLSLFNQIPVFSNYSQMLKSQNLHNFLLQKQIPGVFPSLSDNWQQLLKKWNLTLINSKKGPQSLRQQSFQLKFKHFDQKIKKQNLLYITRQNCQGDIIMNWQIIGSNIFITENKPSDNLMTIPNLLQDEQCIRNNSPLLSLLKFATIWAVSEQYQKDRSINDAPIHYVLIGQTDKK